LQLTCVTQEEDGNIACVLQKEDGTLVSIGKELKRMMEQGMF
jgi:hypothetical protein